MKRWKNDIEQNISGCWVDAHCHLSNDPLAENYLNELKEAKKHNISLFISTALTIDEAEWHLCHTHPDVKLVAGIHPYYDKRNLIDIEYLRDLAENNLIWGIGEVGFDKRKKNHNYQDRILREQLDLALEYNLPVVFHIVGRYNELYKILNFEYPNIRGYIHGFTGSPEMFQMYSRLDIGFSLGHRILNQKNAVPVIEAILEHGFFLFETDAPFQRDNTRSKTEPILNSLLDIAQSVSDMTSYGMEELLDGQWGSYKMLLQQK